MASHLSLVSSIPPGIGAGKPSASHDDAPGGFAAFLGNTDSKTDNTAPAPKRAHEAAAADNVDAMDGQAKKKEREPGAVAAVVEAAQPVADDETRPVLIELIDDVAALQASLDSGEPVDPELLKRLDAALDDLAQRLGVDLDQIPALDALRNIVAEPLPQNADFASFLARALQPMAVSLEEGAVDAGPGFADLVKATGDKLAALVQALNSGAVESGALAQFQPDGAAPVDAELEEALKRLAQAATGNEGAAPKLGEAELDIPEPVLAGKEGDQPRKTAVPESGAPGNEVKPAAASGKEKTGQQADRGAGEARNPAAPPADTNATDAQASTQPAQLARADAIAPRTVQAGYQTSQQQLNLPQLAFEIVRQVSEGNTRFQIRLDPPELGRIEVKLDIDASGRVNARLTVEKAETLDLMQRDQRALERALQQAGLDGNKTNLEFSLRQNPFGGGQQGRDGDAGPFGFFDEVAEVDEAPPVVNLYRGNLSASGVNIIA